MPSVNCGTMTVSPSLSVQTLNPRDVTGSQATLVGEVTELRGADEAEAAFAYRVDGGDLQKTATMTVSGGGRYEVTLRGLDPSSEVSYAAVLSHDPTGESVTGDELSFVPSDPPPEPDPRNRGGLAKVAGLAGAAYLTLRSFS
jgi:hypothetical protein